MSLQRHLESKLFRHPWRMTSGVLLLVFASMLGLWLVVDGVLSTANEKLSVVLAAGQFFSGLLLIPVAIFGFEFARREFEEGQAKPRLDLAVCDPADNTLKKEAALKAETFRGLLSFKVNIHIENSGDAIADLYMIELSGLRELTRPGGRMTCEINEHTPFGGSGWKDETEGKGKITYVCRNVHPVFPHQDAPLCELSFTLEEASCRPPFKVGYKIYLGSEKPAEKVLRIDLKARNPVGPEPGPGAAKE